MSVGTAKILVVDDDEAARYVKAHVLKKHGYAVAEAGLGRTAIDEVASGAPDLVLLDVKLPDVSGIDVCRQIKSTFPNVIVLQTSAAFTAGPDRARALEGGADSYLVEPIEPDELVATISALLRMRRAEQELRRVNERLETLVLERTRKLDETNRRLEREIASRRETEDVLWHTQKLDVLGQLTGGVAHDFNNLLMVIAGSLELIRDVLEGRRDVPLSYTLRLLATAESAAARGAQITRQLLAFARRSVLSAETVCLNDLIAGWEGFLRRALGETITLTLSLAPGLWSCRVDPAQFETAILNLIVNARDAMPNGGRVRIETSNIVVEDASAAAGLAPGPYVCLQVVDTGVGMEPDVIEHAFEPFFTTKETGKGSGLGLSQVYGFAKQSGGSAIVDSTPGTGTTFRLWLPRSETPPAQRPATAKAAESTPVGTETVLVVEDNDEVREVAVAMIGDLGYRVLAASDGSQAIELLRRGEPVDLLFSDILMPGINGIDLAKQARSIRPGLQALLTSGYASKHGAAFDTGEFPILQKPYRRAELARTIRATIDARAETAESDADAP